MFSAAPGAETKYRNGSYVSPGIFGNSGSSLFPPTRIRLVCNVYLLLLYFCSFLYIFLYLTTG